MAQPWHSVESDGFIVESNVGTAAETTAALETQAIEPQTPPAETPPPAPVAEPPTKDEDEDTELDQPERPRDPTTGQFVKPEDQPQPPKEPRNSPRARIERAIAKQRDAERRAQALEAELATLRQPARPAPTPASPPPVHTATNGEDPEPQLANFESYEAFVKAQARWEARQEFREAMAAQQRQQQEQQRQQSQLERAKAFKAHIDAAKKADPEVLERLDPEVLAWTPLSALDPHTSPRVEHAIAEVILRSPRPLSLLQHFSDHPDEIHRLAQVPPEHFLWEMGRLEAKLEAAVPGPAPASSMSRAKPLIKPAGGAPQTSDPNAITDDLSFEEHFERMNRLDRERARTRR